MKRDAVYELLSKIPKVDIAKTVLTLRFHAAITLDLVIRYEDEYFVVRGREAGSNDEGRAFFVPYDEILFVKLDRAVRLSEMQRMYGVPVTSDDESILDREAEGTAEAKSGGTDKAGPKDVATITPAPAMDPAAIAKQNLLARIRAARTAAASG